MHYFVTMFLSVIAIIAAVCGCAPEENPSVLQNATEDDKSVRSQKISKSIKSDKLARLTNYALFYGPICDKEISILGKYDAIVIDPMAVGGPVSKKVAKLKKTGCKFVFGYLSCFEVAKWHRYLDLVDDEWIIKINGKAWTPYGENHAVSLACHEWRTLLTALVQTEVLDFGCDGVFIDTLADIDSGDLPEDIRKEQLDGLDKLLADFNEVYPNTVFIVNRTLDQTLPVVSKYVDILCWEDFQPRYFIKGDPAYEYVSATLRHIEELQKDNDFQVWTLWSAAADDNFEANKESMKRTASGFGFLSYCSRGGYNDSNLPIASAYDRK